MTQTWPEDWDARKRGAGCWFCAKQIGEPFYAGRVADAHLERHAIARGHVIVVFRDRHVADFTSLTASEVAAYWGDVHAVAQMVERVFAPCHMNYQLLGNIVPHLHVHLMPRITSTMRLQEDHCRGSPNLLPMRSSIGSCSF